MRLGRGPVQKALYTINNFFTDAAGKGYNALLDDYEITPEEFCYLPRRKKQELVSQFIYGFRNCLKNDLICYGLWDEDEWERPITISFELLSWLIDLGEAARALLNLTERYNVKLENFTVFPSKKDKREVKEHD